MKGLYSIVVTYLLTLEQITVITIPCHGSRKILAKLFAFSCFAMHLNIRHS